MKEKILALLMAKFSGVRKDGLTQLATALSLQASTDEEAATIVGKITADQVNSFVSDWRKEADSEISKANKTYEDGLKKKFDFVEKKAEPEPGKDPIKVDGPIDAKAIQNLIAEAVKAVVAPLQQKIDNFESGNIIQTRKGLIEKELEGSPAKFREKILKDFERMKFDNDEVFTAYLSETKEDAKALVQDLADQGLSSHGRPFRPAKQDDGKEVSAGVQEYIKAQTSESAAKGKEV
jgi:hypothetical protein